jgi:hypothetical protein
MVTPSVNPTKSKVHKLHTSIFLMDVSPDWSTLGYHIQKTRPIDENLEVAVNLTNNSPNKWSNKTITVDFDFMISFGKIESFSQSVL